jgi:hypothetical protein
MARNILPNWLTSLWSRKPVSIKASEVWIRVYDINEPYDKFKEVTLQEAYDEIHSFMNRNGSIMKLVRENFEDYTGRTHETDPLPEDLEEIKNQ